MGEKGFFILFGLAIIGMFLTGVNDNLSGDVATTTDSYQQATTRNNGVQAPSAPYVHSHSISQGGATQPAQPQKTNDEIKAELEDLYDELWELEQAVDKAKRREPVSRYADDVRFSKPFSYNYNNSPDLEYFSITVNQDGRSINISDWYIESVVTDTKAAIPDGVPLYRSGGAVNYTKPITLGPGQRAFIISGDSPIGESFQENSCIGYVARDKTFHPNVTTKCESPTDLMLRYGDINLDDDSCYDFMYDIGRCETIDEDDPRLDDLSGKCRRFIKNTFNYPSCVGMFSDRTDFDDVNDWYVYLERDERLWRSKREIIRLIDEYDEVIAVIEY